MIDRIDRDRAGRVAMAALPVLLALHLWSLTRFPGPFVDEAWFGNRAWSFIQSGNPVGSLDQGVVDKFDGAAHFFQTLPMLMQAAALWLAGAPSLFALRMVSLIMGLALAFAIWCIARAWYDGWTAIWSVMLIALSGPFIYSSHFARYDILAAAFGYTAIALYVWTGRFRRQRVILAGFLAGIAFECHPFGLVIVLALPLLAFEEFGWSTFTSPLPQRLVVGLIAGSLVYPALHILPHPQSYFALSRLIYGPTHTPSIRQQGAALGEWFGLIIASFGLLTPLLVWALVSLSGESDSRDRRLLLMTGAIGIAFMVLVRNKQPYYGILFTPPLVMCVAVVSCRLARNVGNPPKVRRRLGLIVIGLLTVSSFIVSIRAMAQDGKPAYDDVVKRLHLIVQPGDRMMGAQTFWFGFSEHPYYSWEQLVYLRRMRPELSIGDALTIMHPDLFIRDDHMEWFILERPGDTTYTQLLWIPKLEIESWLANHATVAADFANPLYGRVRVYRIRWSAMDQGPAGGASTRLR